MCTHYSHVDPANYDIRLYVQEIIHSVQSWNMVDPMLYVIGNLYWDMILIEARCIDVSSDTEGVENYNCLLYKKLHFTSLRERSTKSIADFEEDFKRFTSRVVHILLHTVLMNHWIYGWITTPMIQRVITCAWFRWAYVL